MNMEIWAQLQCSCTTGNPIMERGEIMGYEKDGKNIPRRGFILMFMHIAQILSFCLSYHLVPNTNFAQ